ncbi:MULTISPECIES: hypothetical protein [unclassified Pseudofrankia]|uniref:hypothetical protein n=1 Tax=unclassified Pseudofrankia TaxID=2994372 RepID=UPI0008D91ACC|nr:MULTISPECIES: hypothetical protein [unclassified Pseudofrankia]MDT3445880.1 hypothetical protein [Pseudofrankia sp. BMG5.37]OHV50688.1 hypothetical protein BCD48_10440 [Pseudofrankia sp. BMG5.36]
MAGPRAGAGGGVLRQPGAARRDRLPLAFRFASPLVALVTAALATLARRAGVHRYRSTGS